MIKDFILQNKSGILLCGVSCIGKTHFSHFLKAHDLYHLAKEIKSFHAINSDVQLNTKLKSIWSLKKGVIVLGAPWFIWKKRIEHRKQYFKKNRKKDNIWFKRSYVKCIDKLDELNIPYILIDNRNNYPILDKANFIKMLT